MHKGDLFAYKSRKEFPAMMLNRSWAGSVFYAVGPYDHDSIRVACIAHATRHEWMLTEYGKYEPPILGKEYTIRIKRLERIWNARTGQAVLTDEQVDAFEKSLAKPPPSPKMVEEEYIYDRELV